MNTVPIVILNVDDDDAGRYAVGRQLKQAGYEVREARTGARALELAMEQPDLILLDVRLPDIDGFEVCRRLRANPHTSTIGVIQMSASYLDTSAQVKGLENGADAYLTEPTEPAILIATINSVLRIRRAEQSVREAASQWQSTFDAIQEGVAVLNADGEPVRFNDAFRRIAGVEVTGLFDTLRRGMETLRSGETHLDRFAAEQTIGDKCLAITVDPMRDEAGDLNGAVCVVADITEKKRLEAQLRQTAKLESIGVLAGGIAHDFNNLLTGILGNSSMIVESLPEVSPERELAQEVVRASESAADLTRQLLAYAGKGRFVMKPVDLSALAQESQAFVRRFVPSRVNLIFETAPELPPIEADPGQMQQLTMNLIINAAESFAADDYGTVTVRTSIERLDAQFFNASEICAPGDYVVLTVSDNGSGMDETTLSRVFDPFFTTKFAGRGLGLSAVHGILQGHRGYLRLTSRVGEGSTFRLYFPASKVVLPDKKTPSPHKFRGSGNILMVDDESTIRIFVKMALENRGYQVILAENGQQGVDVFRARHNSLNLVILDFTMPVMNGEEAYEHMRAIAPGVPVILSSGFSEMTAAERFSGKGLAGFLSKPYTIGQLTAAVAAGISSHQTGKAQSDSLNETSVHTS